MEISTGYFSKAKTYMGMGYALVSIARVAPWFLSKELKLYSCDELTPTDEMLALKDQPNEYEPRYFEEILHPISPIKIFNKLYLIARREATNKVVLLCYESPEKFCHRHLVAKWLMDKLGQKVEEVNLTRPDRDFGLSESDVL